MKLKTLVIGGSGLFLMVFSLLLFVAILFSDEQDSGISNIHYGGVNVSAEVLAHKPMVEKYAKEYGVEEYVNILLAIIQVESGGTAEDVMQSSAELLPQFFVGKDGFEPPKSKDSTTSSLSWPRASTSPARFSPSVTQTCAPASAAVPASSSTAGARPAPPTTWPPPPATTSTRF